MNQWVTPKFEYPIDPWIGQGLWEVDLEKKLKEWNGLGRYLDVDGMAFPTGLYL